MLGGYVEKFTLHSGNVNPIVKSKFTCLFRKFIPVYSDLFVQKVVAC